MIDFVKDEEFSFWLPMDISKADKPDSKGRDRWVQGIASTEDQDLQNETVYQRGIDFSYFLDHGFYNNDHKPGFENKVGQPTECRIEKSGLWTKGFLFKDHKIADSIWELANALIASKSDRKLGFSIQGKVLHREGRRIIKSWIQDIAITAAPINTNTWLDVLKSLLAVPSELWVPGNGFVEISPRQVSPVHKSCGKCPGCDGSKACHTEKSVFTGLALDERDMDLKKDGDEDEDDKKKALSTSSPSGQALSVESLEGKMKDQGWAGAKTKEVNKSLSFNECVDILCEHRRLSIPDATAVVEAVFTMNGISQI